MALNRQRVYEEFEDRYRPTADYEDYYSPAPAPAPASKTLNDLLFDYDVKNVAKQLAGVIDPSSSGGAWSTQSGKSSGPGFGPEGFLEKMAENFVRQTGLGDINQLGERTSTEFVYDPESGTTSPVSQTTYFNKATGEPVNFSGSLGGYAQGPGFTATSLSFAGDKPSLRTIGEDTSDLKKYGLPLAVIAAFVAPELLPELLATGGGEAALLAAESGIASGGAGIAGLGTAGAAELGGLAALGEGAGAAASVGGAEAGLGSLASNLTVGEVASVISNPTSLITKPLTEAITNQIVSQLGLSGTEVTLAKTAVASAVNAGTAELLGGDPAKAALATVGGTAFNAVAGPIIGDIAKNVTASVTDALDIELSNKAFDSITKGITNSISTGVTTALAGGDAQDVLINSGVAFIGGALAKEKIPGTRFDETDLGELIPGYFDDVLDEYKVTGGEGTQIQDNSVVVSAPRLNDIPGGFDIAEPPVIKAKDAPSPPSASLEVRATAECPPGQVDTGFGCAPIEEIIDVAEPPVIKAKDGAAPSASLEVRATRECPPGQVDTGFGCAPIVAEPPVVTPEPPATTECAPGFHDVNGLCVADDDRLEETECPEGQVRNLDTGLCEAPKATTCPNGYSLNPKTGQCEVNVSLMPLPGMFSNLFKDSKDSGDAGYSPNLREKFMAQRTYTPPPEDYDYFTDPYFQRFGPISYVPPENYAGAGKAEGGLMSLAKGGRTSLPPRYLDGHSDGMADKVPASIDAQRPAALSDGEFVIPADVVSHLGNGNSNAGAKVLYAMMDRIRRARTGNSKQGKQINPSKFMPR
jgi:hypothetical protein